MTRCWPRAPRPVCSVCLPSRQPLRDLLEQPAVAVRIAELGIAVVGGAVRVRARSLSPLAHVVDLADVDTVPDQFITRGLDVVDGRLQALKGSGFGRDEVLTERKRATRAGRGDLDDSNARGGLEVDVHPPTEALVERLRPIDIGDGQGDDLESELAGLRYVTAGRRLGACVSAGRVSAHLDLRR